MLPARSESFLRVRETRRFHRIAERGCERETDDP